MIFSKRSVTAIGLGLIVVFILTVEIDSAVLAPMRIAHPATKNLQLRRGIPARLAERNRLRLLHLEEALLILESRPDIHGTWLRVLTLKRGEHGWVAGWLVTPAKVTPFSARPTRYRLGTRLYHLVSARVQSYYGYVLAWFRTFTEQIIATIAAVFFFRWLRRRRRRGAAT